jgi:hypothetical protein
MSTLLRGVISELVLILLNLDFEIDHSGMNLGRFLNDIHIPIRAKYYPHSNSFFVLSFVKGCVQLSFEFFFENDLLPRKKDFASLTQKYWCAYLHSEICVHHQYIHNFPISIIMV